MIEELAIVLGSIPYQERDRIVYLLTENEGKKTGIAKGAIHSRRFGPAFDLFNCIEVRYREKSSQNLVHIQEAQVHYGFPQLRKSLEAITTASYFTDLCKRITEGHAPAREVFLFLVNYLYLLEQVEVSPEILRSFELKLLACLGCAPIIEHCIACNSSKIVSASGQAQEKILYLSIANGGLLCANCYNYQESTVNISPKTIEWIREVRASKIKDLVDISPLSEKNLKEMDFLKHYIQYHCNNLNIKEIPSYTMMKKLLATTPLPQQDREQ